MSQLLMTSAEALIGRMNGAHDATPKSAPQVGPNGPTVYSASSRYGDRYIITEKTNEDFVISCARPNSDKFAKVSTYNSLEGAVACLQEQVGNLINEEYASEGANND